MTRFTLAVLPDGRAILATPERLDVRQAQELQQVVAGWRDGRWPVVVLAECDVVQVAELEIDLDRQPVAV